MKKTWILSALASVLAVWGQAGAANWYTKLEFGQQTYSVTSIGSEFDAYVLYSQDYDASAHPYYAREIEIKLAYDTAKIEVVGVFAGPDLPATWWFQGISGICSNGTFTGWALTYALDQDPGPGYYFPHAITGDVTQLRVIRYRLKRLAYGGATLGFISACQGTSDCAPASHVSLADGNFSPAPHADHAIQCGGNPPGCSQPTAGCHLWTTASQVIPYRLTVTWSAPSIVYGEVKKDGGPVVCVAPLTQLSPWHCNNIDPAGLYDITIVFDECTRIMDNLNITLDTSINMASCGGAPCSPKPCQEIGKPTVRAVAPWSFIKELYKR